MLFQGNVAGNSIDEFNRERMNEERSKVVNIYWQIYFLLVDCASGVMEESEGLLALTVSEFSGKLL